MPDIPRYPAGDGPEGRNASDTPPERASGRWRAYLLLGAGVALVLLMGVLHLTGVLGPGGH